MAEPTARPVLVTGMDVVTGSGRGTTALAEAVFTGTAAFVPVDRFDTGARRAKLGAQLADVSDLLTELTGVVDGACTAAGLTAADRAATPLLFAGSSDRAAARPDGRDRAELAAGAIGARLAAATGLRQALRSYTTACVAASTAAADAAAMIAAGRADRVVVAAGYLLEADRFALFDSARALASDGRMRPFGAGRKGMLLGDAVAAVVLESEASAAGRSAVPLARLTGWGRAGDAHHVSQPHPQGTGLARAIGLALRRAGLAPGEVDYVNAHGTGTPASDLAESAALHRALGPDAARVPLSSSKSVHGHTLEAAGLVELAVSVLTLTEGRLPVNAGRPEPDPACPVALVTEPRTAATRHVLSLNSAFGGANTALLVSA
ncbi:beta-ketoacyl synthase N-terminal-like domain-containing protein [Kitasatospora kazusensis]|uniref:Beta-ketoacyl synthase N-terminal-like domain-containing protein n=1 Tax=Kitasatospora kazusensis TaxID=407974 RepID=A0ABP5KK97_9ACTN